MLMHSFILYSCTLFAPLILVSTCKQEEHAGYVNVSNSRRIQVSLDCQQRMMAIHIRFNSSITPWFTNWIVVGDGSRPECRIKGDGSLEYLIEVPLHGNQCGTVKILPNTFEALIGVKKSPFLILDGDDFLRVRCTYGYPQVQMPNVPSSPAKERQSILPFLTERTPFDVTMRTGISPSSSQIYLITGISLLLIALCALYACLYYCFKRRQKRLKESRSTVVHSAGVTSASATVGGPTSEATGGYRKGAVSPVWWPPPTSRETVSQLQPALISHEYMLSMSTNGSVHGATSTGSVRSTPSVRESAHLRRTETATTVDGLESRVRRSTTVPKAGVGAWASRKGSKIASRLSALYSAIDTRKKRRNSFLAAQEEYPPDITNYARSVSEIYARPNEVLIDDRPMSYKQEFMHRRRPLSPVGYSVLLEEYLTAIRQSTLAHLDSVRLTTTEADRIERLITQDTVFQQYLLNASTYEDLKRPSELPEYESYFTSEQWSRILKCLNGVLLKRSQLRASDSWNGGEALQRRPSQRLFTQDSFRRLQRQMEMLSEDDQRIVEQGGEEIVNDDSAPAGYRSVATADGEPLARSNEEIFAQMPHLSMYHGNILRRVGQSPAEKSFP
uniref:ZP domain-containing protein n=1 Tax=Trichuris muris TaxID=70415 RepID=A0A5S6Q4M8_TRIMR